MAKVKKNETSANLKNKENVAEQSKLTTWMNANLSKVLMFVAIIALVVVGVVCVNKYYWSPRVEEAQDLNGKAYVYLATGDYEKALNGDEDNAGFLDIADKYHNKAGKLAACYAGICYYNLEKYEEAVEYLDKYDADDKVIAPAAKMRMGDAYVALEQYEEAAKCFEKAAKQGNDAIAPIALKKAGLAYEKLEETEKALAAYKKIKDNYPASAEATEVDMNINSLK